MHRFFWLRGAECRWNLEEEKSWAEKEEQVEVKCWQFWGTMNSLNSALLLSVSLPVQNERLKDSR